MDTMTISRISRPEVGWPFSLELKESTPKLTAPLMQKLEKRRNLYIEKHKSGGFWGFLKSAFGAVGSFFKGVAESALNVVTGVLNPTNWVKPSFWRDIVVPVVLNFILGVGPVLATAYRWGMAAYKGVKAMISLVHGKIVDAFSFAVEALSSVAKLTHGAFSKGAAKVAAWIRKGIDIYRKGEAIYREVRS